ncbi:transposase [bacterium]|nr:transposase [bacterium]
MARRFMSLYDDYSHHFIARGMNSVDHARHYLSGLLGTQRRKNIETFCDDVKDSDYQGIEQFVSSSPWDEHAVLNQLALDVSEEIGSEG